MSTRKEKQPLLIYHNQELMNDLNDMMIRIKKLIPEKEIYSTKICYDLDKLQFRLNDELRKDNEPMVKH